ALPLLSSVATPRPNSPKILIATVPLGRLLERAESTATFSVTGSPKIEGFELELTEMETGTAPVDVGSPERLRAKFASPEYTAIRFNGDLVISSEALAV